MFRANRATGAQKQLVEICPLALKCISIQSQMQARLCRLPRLAFLAHLPPIVICKHFPLIPSAAALLASGPQWESRCGGWC